MRAAVEILDRVREAVDVFGVTVVPLQRDLDPFAVFLVADEDRLFVQRRLRFVQIANERDDAAFVAELVFLFGAFILDDDEDAGVEKGELAKTLRERFEMHLGDGEDRRIGFERDARSALGSFFSPRDRHDRDAAFVALTPNVIVAMNLQLQPLGKKVDDGHADAVQAAGDLVRVVVEFSAGVQLGHDHFGRAAVLFFVQIDRNAATVVFDGHGVVVVDGDVDFVGVAGERFIDGVVDDFVDHVMQSGDVVGVADVHAGALADGVQAFEYFDVFGGVIARDRRRLRRHFGRVICRVIFCVIVCHSVLSGVGFGGRWRVSRRAQMLRFLRRGR